MKPCCNWRSVFVNIDVGNGDGSDFHLEIVMDGKIVHTVKFNELDKDKLVKKFDHIKVKFSEEENINVSADVKFRFISSNSVKQFSCKYTFVQNMKI